jgi:hypothetical protein
MSNDNGNYSPATDWKPKLEPLDLPSGKTIEVRQFDVLGMILSNKDGEVPDFITSQVASDISGKGKKKTPALTMAGKDFPQLVKFVNQICRTVMVNPRICKGEEPNYEDGEISIDDMEVMDRMYIFETLMPHEEQFGAGKFRQKPGETVAIAHKVENVQPDSE